MTASMADVVMGGLATKGLADYVKTLAFERVFGDTSEEGYRSKAMERGNEVETLALDWYEFHTDQVVDREPVTIGHPTIPFVAASPDARLPDRNIEVKSPLHKAWMDVKKSRKVPAEYRWQCRWQMWVRGVPSCDFVCWHPKPGGLIVPFTVTPEEIEQMTERVFIVDQIVNEWVAVLRDTKVAA